MLGCKLSRVLLVTFLFGSLNFLTAGVGACLLYLIEYQGRSPEMFGWWGTLYITGLVCVIFNSGSLVVNIIFTILSKASNTWISILVTTEAFFLGVLFLISIILLECLENHLGNESFGQIIFWILASVLSAIGWIAGNYLKKEHVNPVNPV